MEYGDPVGENIASTISGFAYVDENESTVFPDGSGGVSIPYTFTDETGSVFKLESVKERGIYTIEVTAPVSGNYVMDYGLEHGDLTITEAILTFTVLSKTIDYGGELSIEPYFKGFADGESDDVLKVNGEIPYFFMKDGTTFTMLQMADMNVGDYEIFITDDVTDNYVFSPDTKLGTLTVKKATLNVEISPEELIINQGDIPTLTTTFVSGSVYGQGVNDVFPAGIPYYYEGESGIFENTSVPGVFKVRIADPTNYVIAHMQ